MLCELERARHTLDRACTGARQAGAPGRQVGRRRRQASQALQALQAFCRCCRRLQAFAGVAGSRQAGRPAASCVGPAPPRARGLRGPCPLIRPRCAPTPCHTTTTTTTTATTTTTTTTTAHRRPAQRPRRLSRPWSHRSSPQSPSAAIAMGSADTVLDEHILIHTMCSRLQHYVLKAATQCARGSELTHCACDGSDCGRLAGSSP